MTPDERRRLVEVRQAILDAVAEGRPVLLPRFDPALSVSPHQVGPEPNPYGGTLGEYRYQFEGEEDLLHLIVTRLDGGELTPDEGRQVAGVVLDGVPPALVWFKAGTVSQHFYCGHDDLPGARPRSA